MHVMEKPTLTGSQFEELWRQTVHNKAHQILHDLQDLHSAFETLVDSGLIIGNQMDLIKRDIQLARVYIQQLTDDLPKAHSIVQGYCRRLTGAE
jgi:hypothetical protein